MTETGSLNGMIQSTYEIGPPTPALAYSPLRYESDEDNNADATNILQSPTLYYRLNRRSRATNS